jgi:hypothetical protein
LVNENGVQSRRRSKTHPETGFRRRAAGTDIKPQAVGRRPGAVIGRFTKPVPDPVAGRDRNCHRAMRAAEGAGLPCPKAGVAFWSQD